MSTSYHILLTTFGSFGDVHPYMALAQELQRRGHEATIGTGEFYRDKISSAGIKFVPVRPNLDDSAETGELVKRAMNRRTGTTTVIRDMVLSQLRGSYVDTLAAASKCDLIISHGLTYSAPIVAEQMAIPWVFTALQPIIFFSAIDPSAPPFAPWVEKLRVLGPRVYRALMVKGLAQLETWAEPIWQIRREAGLPKPIDNPLTFGQFSPFLNLGLFSSVFAPAAADWPERTVQTGFAFYDAYDRTQRPMPEKLVRFLDKGRPPIVFTLGTAAVRDAGRFFHESLSAARSIGERAVLLTGIETQNDIGLQLGDDAVAIEYAPYSELFPRAVVNVHQGGIGTTAQALRSGRPMLVMPFAHDQFDNALRCKQLGVAATISRDRYTASPAAKALRALLCDRLAVKTADLIASQVRAENGASTACDQIESLLRWSSSRKLKNQSTTLELPSS
jgi:rhamnosyltransferase subunit B